MISKLYMDEHVPSAITEGLRRRGVDVLTAQEDGRTGEDDPELLDRASACTGFFLLAMMICWKKALAASKPANILPASCMPINCE